MILEGVLVLSSDHDAVDAASEIARLMQLYRLCAAAYLDGVRRVLVLDPDREWIGETAVAQFNKILGSRGCARMAVRVVEPGGATQQRVRAAWAERDAVAGRRGVLRASRERAPDPLADLQAVAADLPGAIFVAAPVISAEKCNGCDACLRVCPYNVLTQIKDGPDRSHYSANPAPCDACGLCAELCSPSAIKVLTMVNAPDDIPLTDWLCPECGAPTHAPEVQNRGDGSCRICAATGHHKKLHQVLT